MRLVAIAVVLAGCGGEGGGGSEPESATATGWPAAYAGLDLDGMEIPRVGVYNSTLNSVYGTGYDSYGAVLEYEGQSFSQGKVSWFGGPNDTGVTATETGAITGEVLRQLNDPLNPTAEQLAAEPDQYYFCAMRFDYTSNGKSWWKTARILVINPANGVAVVVRAVDWGPALSTKRTLDLSPQAIKDLGLVTDQFALVAFAAPTTPLGLLQP